MKQRHHLNKTGISRRQQFGQSMVEYTIVISLGILAISSAPMRDAVDDLMATIRQNYAGYSFAISLSDYPDYDSASDYWGALNSQEVNKDMKNVLTDQIRTDSTRKSTKYMTAIKKYHTGSPDSLSGQQPKSKIPGEAGDLKNRMQNIP